MFNFNSKVFLFQFVSFLLFCGIYLFLVPATKIFYCDDPTLSDVLPESYLYFVFPLLSLASTYLFFKNLTFSQILPSILLAIFFGYLFISIFDLVLLFANLNLRQTVVSDSCRTVIYSLQS
jgi:hypothetical protein